MVKLIMIDDLRSKIRHIDDWPTRGVSYTDTSKVFSDAELFGNVVRALAEPYLQEKPDIIAGIEARGFLLAGALAFKLGCGVVVVRRRGKLPQPVVSQEYSYEYASNVIEMSQDAVTPGQKVVLVDDVLATGATMAAAIKLIKKLGADIAGISFMVEKEFLSPRQRLGGYAVHGLLKIQ